MGEVGPPMGGFGGPMGGVGTPLLEATSFKGRAKVREVEVTVTTEPTYPLSLSGVFSRVSSALSTCKITRFYLVNYIVTIMVTQVCEDFAEND